MRTRCREIERYLTTDAESLPEAVRAHLADCEPCRRAWALEERYRRAVQAARGEPIPVCRLPWSRVQAQLAARAVARTRPALGRFAPALSVAVVALFALGVALLSHAPQPREVAYAQPNTRVVDAPATSFAAPTTDAAPLFADTTRLTPPHALPSDAPTAPAQASSEATDSAHTRVRRQPPEIESIVANDLDSGVSYQVAALPMSQFRIGDGAEVDYLPFNYGNSTPEGVDEDAMVGSF
ncbi:MAG: hypothetical protein ACK4ME_05965 [Fimbriimonadales bacterium]